MPFVPFLLAEPFTMEVDNSEWKILTDAIDNWEKEGKLTPEKAGELRQGITVKKTSQQIAQYFFLIALSCTLMAFGAIFIDERLLERLKIYFSLNNIIVALLMAVLAGSWFYFIKRKSTQLRTIAYEIYTVLGALAALTSLVYFCKDFGFGPSYSGFLICAAILLFGLSVYFNSRALWIGTIAALMGWFGTFTYAHSTNHLFLGMNYPVRFTLFGLLLLGASFLQRKVPKLLFTQRFTYLAGLIIFFTGLWGVSIFGNYNNLEAWLAVRQTHVLAYAFVFGAAALIALYTGIRYKDDLARDLGILFLLINFYSRYFEYFWDAMHKGIFFLVLAVSFYFLGRCIEKKRRADGQQAEGREQRTESGTH
jgi:hypothetical protein